MSLLPPPQLPQLPSQLPFLQLLRPLDGIELRLHMLLDDLLLPEVDDLGPEHSSRTRTVAHETGAAVPLAGVVGYRGVVVNVKFPLGD